MEWRDYKSNLSNFSAGSYAQGRYTRMPPSPSYIRKMSEVCLEASMQTAIGKVCEEVGQSDGDVEGPTCSIPLDKNLLGRAGAEMNTGNDWLTDETSLCRLSEDRVDYASGKRRKAEELMLMKRSTVLILPLPP